MRSELNRFNAGNFSILLVRSINSDMGINYKIELLHNGLISKTLQYDTDILAEMGFNDMVYKFNQLQLSKYTGK